MGLIRNVVCAAHGAGNNTPVLQLLYHPTGYLNAGIPYKKSGSILRDKCQHHTLDGQM